MADLNGDGRLDAVVGYEAVNKLGKLAWYEQPQQAYAPWTEHLIADLIGPMSLAVADMDGDSDLDVVVGEHYPANPSAARMFACGSVMGWVPVGMNGSSTKGMSTMSRMSSISTVMGIWTSPRLAGTATRSL